jgi:hypothetical protein
LHATALGSYPLKASGIRSSDRYVLTVLLFLPGHRRFTQLFGWRESTNELRLITGFPFGIGYAYLIVWALPFVFALAMLIGTHWRQNAETDALVMRIKKMVWLFFK